MKNIYNTFIVINRPEVNGIGSLKNAVQNTRTYIATFKNVGP